MKLEELENMLGILAMKFRGCCNKHNHAELRKIIAQEYAEIVFELIESGIWKEIPAPEDQLTNEYMPEVFFKYWGMNTDRKEKFKS